MQILHGDCLELLPTLQANSIDAIVTDPPYHLLQNSRNGSAQPGDLSSPYGRHGPSKARGFMNTEWDGGDIAFRPDVWRECLRVLKPGGHLAAFGGSRTHHRLWCAIEDAGFEVRDTCMWLHAQGFPKSLDVSKAIDKHLGAEREIVGYTKAGASAMGQSSGWNPHANTTAPPITAPATPEAQQFAGWGTALKPSHEPILLARKPLISPAMNVLDMVESSLRARGFTNIRWKDSVGDASASRSRTISLSIDQPQMAETSVDSADESETVKDENKTRKSSVVPCATGTRPILAGRDITTTNHTTNCATTSSMPMDKPVHVVGNKKETFLSSTISTVVDQSIGDQIGTKSISSLDRTAILQDTESFAGIATGLTGSMAHVRIERDKDEIFIWPKDLPKLVTEHHNTVAQNVLRNGTGGINVDACRVPTDESTFRPNCSQMFSKSGVRDDNGNPATGRSATGSDAGRWPANLLHDGSEEVVECFPVVKPRGNINPGKGGGGMYGHGPCINTFGSDGITGSAARFFSQLGFSEDERRGFYCSKASKRDRAGSKHPTVKPQSLMRWLCKLICPPGGVILDPFAGSGSTGQAAMNLGFDCILIEREDAYIEDIHKRLEA